MQRYVLCSDSRVKAQSDAGLSKKHGPQEPSSGIDSDDLKPLADLARAMATRMVPARHSPALADAQAKASYDAAHGDKYASAALYHYSK